MNNKQENSATKPSPTLPLVDRDQDHHKKSRVAQLLDLCTGLSSSNSLALELAQLIENIRKPKL